MLSKKYKKEISKRKKNNARLKIKLLLEAENENKFKIKSTVISFRMEWVYLL